MAPEFRGAEHDTRPDGRGDRRHELGALLLPELGELGLERRDAVSQRAGVDWAAMNYPRHRATPGVHWLARAGATIDDPPLPHLPATAARTRAIRGVFLHFLEGRATIEAICDACDALGLLDGLSTPGSVDETIKTALRPVSTKNVWESVHRPASVTAPSVPG